jgi:hypothetical protein
MEGIKRLSLVNDGLNIDPVSSYTMTQLRHHVAAQALLTNPSPENAEWQIWSHWCRNKLFYVNTILGLYTQVQADSSLPPTQEEHPAPPIVMDTGQLVPTATTRGQPLIHTVTIGNSIPFHIIISSDVEVILRSMHVFLPYRPPSQA